MVAGKPEAAASLHHTTSVCYNKRAATACNIAGRPYKNIMADILYHLLANLLYIRRHKKSIHLKEMNNPLLYFIFKGDLHTLFSAKKRPSSFSLSLTRKASIKDIIEAFGIPHTEVGKIEAGGTEVDFTFCPEHSQTVVVFPFDFRTTQKLPTLLHPEIGKPIRFMVDRTVLKLGRNLRLAGFDTTVAPAKSFRQTGLQAEREGRIIATRNRDLLKCAQVRHGQLIRSQDHRIQIGEVCDRYGLRRKMNIFTRCPECNAILAKVAKDDILHLLEPLTQKYYTSFMRCVGCRKIYWRGSHHHKMSVFMDQIRNRISF
ncbi:Mut7-C RNAse domain-containing protein [Desulforhopalus singaporensis]|nr:Mut7-C RNAse domain-containing protein [Desulforhopalus singaporensis]